MRSRPSPPIGVTMVRAGVLMSSAVSLAVTGVQELRGVQRSQMMASQCVMG